MPCYARAGQLTVCLTALTCAGCTSAMCGLMTADSCAAVGLKTLVMPREVSALQHFAPPVPIF